MVIAGLGLWLGVFDGHAPVGLTLIPAVFTLAVILIVLSMRIADSPGERFLARALWASFHAFGHSPPGAVLVVGTSWERSATCCPCRAASAG